MHKGSRGWFRNQPLPEKRKEERGSGGEDVDRTRRAQTNDVSQTGLGAFDLSRSAVATQLVDQLIDIGHSGCAERMAF